MRDETMVFLLEFDFLLDYSSLKTSTFSSFAEAAISSKVYDFITWENTLSEHLISEEGISCDSIIFPLFNYLEERFSWEDFFGFSFWGIPY